METMECIENSGLLSIRERNRDVDQALRSKRRSLARDARRLDLDEVVKKLQVPTKEELVELVKQLRRNKDMETLQRIRLGLVNAESVTTFMECHGALYTVIGCLTGQDSSVQREAACTMINLGLGIEAHCLMVAEKAGTYLVTLMASSSPQIQDPVAWCIGNLCGGHPKVCKMLQIQGAEEGLVKLLESYAPHVLQSTTYALLQYLITVPERMNVVITVPVVRRLVECLDLVDGEIVEIGWCLFVLSTNKSVCLNLIESGIIPTALRHLEHLTNHQNLNVSAATSLVRVVLNCVGAVASAAVQLCERDVQLVNVVKALLYCPHPHLHTETLQLLANTINAATAHSATGKSLVVNLNLQPRLECAVRSALAAKFTTLSPQKTTFSSLT